MKLITNKSEYLPSNDNKFLMGIDPGGFDGRVFSMCVMKKEGGITIVEAILETTDEEKFKKEVAKAAQYFNIPEPEFIKP